MASWKWGAASLAALRTVTPELALLASETLDRSRWDLMAREGMRDAATQERYFKAGLTRARAGESAHNSDPSRAVHLIPLPLAVRADGAVDWSDTDWLYRCVQTAALVDLCARDHGWEVVWGGWWRTLRDMCHFEVKETAA